MMAIKDSPLIERSAADPEVGTGLMICRCF